MKPRTTIIARDELNNLISVIQQTFGRFSEAVSVGDAIEAKSAADALALHFRRAAEIAGSVKDMLPAGEPVWRAEQALQAMGLRKATRR